MSLLILGLTLALVACAFTLQRRTSAPPGLLLLVYLAPAIFICASLWSVRDDVRLRFALTGLGFKTPNGSAFDIKVGGDREGHDLWISAYDDGETVSGKEIDRRRQRLHQGDFEILPTSDGAGASGKDGASIQLVPSTARSPGLFGQTKDGFLQPVRAVELHSGDILEVGGQPWEVEIRGSFGAPAAFSGPGGLKVEIPQRVNQLPLVRVPLPVLRVAAPSLATYPVAWLRAAAGQKGNLSTETDSFFYLLPRSLLGHRLFLAMGEESIPVERDGQAIELKDRWDVEPGERFYALGRPRWDGNDFQAGGLRDFRSIRLQPARLGAAVAYDTPEIFALPWNHVVDLSEPVREVDGEEVRKLRVHLSMGGWQLADRSLYFRHASLPVALESLAILEFSVKPGTSEFDLGEDTFTAAGPRGQIRGRFGKPLWLGEQHLAAIQIDRIRPPLALGLLALLLALAKWVSARAVQLTVTHALIAGGLEGLLSLRLLLGFQAWALPPFAEEAYTLAVIAWLALPWTFLAVAFPVRGSLEKRTVGRSLLVGAGLALSLVISLILSGGGFAGLLWIALHLGAASVPVLRHFGFGEWAAKRLDGLLDLGPDERRALVGWCLLAFVPTLLRIGLFLIGFRESLQLGRRVALSLIHVPLAITLEALFLVWLWRHIERDRALSLKILWPVTAFCLGTWLVPAGVVSDLGLALLNLPVFLLALTLVLLAAQKRLGYRGRRRSAFIAATVGSLLVLLMLPIGARMVIAVIPDSLANSLHSERNFLRLLDFADPERLEGVARKTSEELAVMAAVLRSYTTVGLTGRGYLNTEVSPHLRSTALREHVPAVFVAAQWGWAGATGLMLVILVITGTGVRLLPNRLPDRHTQQLSEAGLLGTIGGLAALTIVLPSLYMLLANYRLALFTGKNAYLLGLDSTADVLETCLLLLLTGVGAAAVRDG